MSRFAFIGVLTPLLLLGSQAGAEWRSPILGAPPILPPRFTPQGYEVLEQPKPTDPANVAASIPRPAPPPTSPMATGPTTIVPSGATPSKAAAMIWSLPLVDRVLGERERTADLAPELRDAILRIEPMYDPTRLDGPDAPLALVVAAGTASMDNVFADRWRLADDDPNVETKTVYLATAWSMPAGQPCDAFFKNRAHSFGDPALTALDADDCRALSRQQARGFTDPKFVPIVVAPVDVPVFAAPLPGSRLSSQDFWAARRAQIASIQAHLQRKWQDGAARPTEVGAR